MTESRIEAGWLVINSGIFTGYWAMPPLVLGGAKKLYECLL